MNFFRRRSSPGLVALVALTMQAALFLAQMHVHTGMHVHAPARLATAISCRAVVNFGCQPAVPHDHGNNDCPMCWSVAAAGTGVMPTAPDVTIDAPRFATLAPLRAEAGRPGHAIINFRARAPPVA